MEILENNIQWIAILVTSLGAVFSVVYSAKGVSAERLSSEINSFISLTERYNALLDKILTAKAFQKEKKEEIGEIIYTFYSIFEIFNAVYIAKKYQKEVGKDYWHLWEGRIRFLFEKPATRLAWENQAGYHNKIYSTEFVKFIEGLQGGG